MEQILFINVSPRREASASRTVAGNLTTKLTAQFPSAKLIVHDLAVEQLPHLDGTTLQAISTPDPVEAARLRDAARRSNQLVEELLKSDLLIIATPMWNFGLPSALKAWIDLVVRPEMTFRYTPDGVEGLARATKAILVLASGGVFTEGPWRSWDYVEPYLRQILSFIGIVDVQTVRVEGMNIPSLATTAISNAVMALEELSL